MWRVLPATIVAFVVASALMPQTAEAATSAGPYLTLLFSRSAVTASSNCVADDTNVARLDTVVAPTLSSLGLHPTGSIETTPTKQDSLWCGHYKETLFASWSVAAQLASQYGWSFVSHTATYPYDETGWSALSPQGLYDETCGSEQQITAHGLPGASGSMAWPNGYVYGPAVTDVEACFDFSRTFGNGITDQATGTLPPYNESAHGFQGGACNDASAACYTYSFAHAPLRYRSPTSMSQLIASAQPSQWLTLQSYVLVTGSRPGLWDCTSPDWRQHWTYDTERYCWNDYLSVVSSIPSGVTVTDPASVGAAWGRVATGQLPMAAVTLSPATSTIVTGATQAYTAEGYDSLGHDLGDVTAQTTFTISGSGTCAANACGAPLAGAYTVTGAVGGVSGVARLNVSPGSALSSITLSPTASTIAPGATQLYGAEGYDALGTDLGDVTFETVFTMSGSGTCSANACGASTSGPYTVTGTDGATSATAELTVGGLPPASIVLSPASSTITGGSSQTYRAEGYDSVGNDLGDVTAQTVFTISGPGSCTGNACGATQPGAYVVTGTDGTVSGTAQLSVVAPLTISSFSPGSGVVGTPVTISGTGFSGVSTVTFAGTNATFTVVSSTQITATVPTGATTGPITVTTIGGSTTSASPFLVGPAIGGFTPTGGPVGSVVTINGSAFTGATAVKFNGTASVFSVVSYGQITATVPLDAITGKITVTTPSGTGSSGATFQVKPTITGFSPASGPVGTTVTITGTGFAGATAVKFHGTAASFTIVSSTQIRATVPAGATSGAISVSTAGGTARSAARFKVTKVIAAP